MKCTSLPFEVVRFCTCQKIWMHAQKHVRQFECNEKDTTKSPARRTWRWTDTCKASLHGDGERWEMEGGKITAFSMKDMPSCFIKTTVAAHAVVRTCLPACPTFQFTLTFACPPSGFPLRKAKFDRSRFSLCFLFVYIYTASCKH